MVPVTDPLSDRLLLAEDTLFEEHQLAEPGVDATGDDLVPGGLGFALGFGDVEKRGTFTCDIVVGDVVPDRNLGLANATWRAISWSVSASTPSASMRTPARPPPWR